MTHKFKYNNHTIEVDANYYKGYHATLEEPGEPDGWEINDIVVDDNITFYDDILELLNLTDQEFDELLQDELNNEFEQWIYDRFVIKRFRGVEY